MSKNYQFIWSWNWCGVGRSKPYPYAPRKKYHGSVYTGGLRLGFLEIRKWCRNDFEKGEKNK